jgi:diguanylate cyclase (GGDEF)-like protein
MGFAIAAMHYLGMASMQMDAVIHWNLPLVLLSLAIGFGASLFGLWLVVRVRVKATDFGFSRRLLAAALLGFGVAGLHYVAMASSTFLPTAGGMNQHPGFKTNSIVLMLAIGAAVMLAVLIGGAGIDQRRAGLAKDLSLVADLARRLARLGDSRARACEAIGELAAADYVLLIEPDADDRCTITASSGTDADTDYSHFARNPHVALSMGRGSYELIADLAAEQAAGAQSADLSDPPGAASALFEPLLLDGRAVGVLVVVWRERIRQLSERTQTFLGMLAAEAAVAISRETLLHQLEYLSRRDELTGLLNRRVLSEELERELASIRREPRPLSLVMLDLDHFKDYNDEHGHQAGDRLLRSAAAAWSDKLRETDTIARYGGEEFVVILPDCTLQAAVVLADQLRQALPQGATCSAGVATTLSVTSAAELIGRADRALYAAKRAGRNLTRAESSTPAAAAAA